MIFVSLSFGFAAPQKESNSTCHKKTETVETVFDLLPETEKSCEEIAKIVIQEEDDEGNQIHPEYKELFLQVCQLKKKGIGLKEIKLNLGLPVICSKK